MPGVPPDAANIVKRVFKGIFKRGKKNKQDGADTTGTTSTPPPQQDQAAAHPTQQSSTPQIDTKAPQLPPIGNASPLQGATESSKPVPPTHPLSTGEHSTPQEAVQLSKSADPAPGPPLGGGAATSGVTSTNDNLKEPEKLGAGNGDVSPPVSTVDAADAPKSGAVSAISNEQSKTDGAGDRISSEGAKAEEAPAAEPSAQAPPDTTANTTTTATESTESAPAAAKENIAPQTNGASPNDLASSTPTDTTAAPISETTASDSKAAPSDEKMSAMEEPPPIKTVRAAPGMSATSGPLEDFPEGGDVKD